MSLCAGGITGPPMRGQPRPSLAAEARGRIIVRGKLVSRGRPRRADYVLFDKQNLPIAVVEAKDNSHAINDGIQQALGYAESLGAPFVFSSNGDGFLFHGRTTSTT